MISEFAAVRALHAELSDAIEALGESDLERLAPIPLHVLPENSAALRFVSSVSWMYVAVWERGSVTFRFLAERGKLLGLDPRFQIDGFRRVINALRTTLQHGLDLTSPRAAGLVGTASHWMATACGRPETPGQAFWPSQEGTEWDLLATTMVKQSCEFLQVTRTVVRIIAEDPGRSSVIREWVQRTTQGLPAPVFDRLIREGTQALGLPTLDAVRVRNVHLARWNERLRLLDPATDLTTVARNLVDTTLVAEWQVYCPLNGDDVIAHFAISPGPRVRELLERAQQLWRDAPCTREELIARLTSNESRASL